MQISYSTNVAAFAQSKEAAEATRLAQSNVTVAIDFARIFPAEIGPTATLAECPQSSRYFILR